MFSAELFLPFQIAVHYSEKHLEEQIDRIYQHRKKIEPRLPRHDGLFRPPRDLFQQYLRGCNCFCMCLTLNAYSDKRCVLAGLVRRWWWGLGEEFGSLDWMLQVLFYDREGVFVRSVT